MNSPLVSVIMPAYNAEKYIKQAIQSLIDQTYTHWELLIIDDGSVDNTEGCVKQLNDARIRYFKQDNAGVSAARNVGLKHMNGEFFCFLDADDRYPKNSIAARLQCLLDNPDVTFVDGQILYMNEDFSTQLDCRKMTFSGYPKAALLRIDNTCFFGNTWFIRRKKGVDYQFKLGMTHSEDLLFCISIAEQGKYLAVEEPILQYRTGNSSAMSNLKGLEKGYLELYEEIKNKYASPSDDLDYLRLRIRRIMFRSYPPGFSAVVSY